jgi:hypothetical protein
MNETESHRLPASALTPQIPSGKAGNLLPKSPLQPSATILT